MLPDWRAKTVACLASGPSLGADGYADCTRVRASGIPAIVTNTTFRNCPWADALYAYDAAWWRKYLPEIRAIFRGRLFTQSTSRIAGVECVKLHALGFRDFGNSGACAVSLAISAGAARVLMLGYDCQNTGGRSHHHGDHPKGLGNCGSMPRWPAQFGRLARYAKERGVEVINVSRETALTCFPRHSLEEALDG